MKYCSECGSEVFLIRTGIFCTTISTIKGCRSCKRTYEKVGSGWRLQPLLFDISYYSTDELFYSVSAQNDEAFNNVREMIVRNNQSRILEESREDKWLKIGILGDGARWLAEDIEVFCKDVKVEEAQA